MLQDAEIDLKDATKHAPNAFLLALIPFLQKIGVLTFLSIVDVPMKEVTHTIKTKMMTLLLSYLIGCRTVNQVNIALRDELLACQSLEIDSFPDNSGISRFLARIDSYAVSEIQNVSQVLFLAHGLAQNLAGIVLVDLDSTGLVVTGDHFELAESGYFAPNRGAIGYQLNLATASNTGGEVLVNILDPGNTSTSVRFWDLIHGVGDALGFLDERLFIRADRAYGVGAYIQYLLDLNIGFVIKGKDSRTAKRWIRETEEAIDWIEVNETCWVADIGPRQMPKCSKSVRIILIRILKNGEFHDSYLATTLPWSLCDEVDVFHFYNKRVTLEKLIERSKNVLHITHIPTHNFWGIKFSIALRFLAHNLLLWYKHYVLSEDEIFEAMKIFELVSTMAKRAVVVEEKTQGWLFFLKNAPPRVQKLLLLTQLWLRKLKQTPFIILGQFCEIYYSLEELIFDVWLAGHKGRRMEVLLANGFTP